MSQRDEVGATSAPEVDVESSFTSDVRLSFTEDTSVSRAERQWVVFSVRGGLRIAIGNAVDTAIEMLRDGCTFDDLVNVSGLSTGNASTLLQRCAPNLKLHFLVDGQQVGVLVPVRELRGLPLAALPAGCLVRLSPFTSIRCEGASLVVRSGQSAHKLVLEGPLAVAWLATLTQPAPVLTGPASMGSVLVAAGLLDQVTENGSPISARSVAIRSAWSPDDLQFHVASRVGMGDGPYGATYPMTHVEAPRAIQDPLPGTDEVIELPPADLDRLLLDDISLTRALEARASRRAATGPLELSRVGEFLYRCARVRRVDPPGPDSVYETSSRPYPSGGAMYELEIYVTANRVSGLKRGTYYYDAVAHQLRPCEADPQDVDLLLIGAARSAVLESEPDLLISLVSRISRLSWKYEGIAYSITLKNVGVLYQTMYLVATAMGLNACALGSGDTMAAYRACALDPASSAPVGEFMLHG